MNQTHICLVGNVATVPERHQSGGGDSVVRFRVASSPRRFDRDSGRWQDGQTSWYSVSVFRALGDNAFASLNKGDRVVLSGRLRIRNWQAGDKRGTDAEIDVEALGHDLMWGTTTFEPRPRGGAEQRREDGWTESPTASSGAPLESLGSGVEAAPALEWDTSPLGSTTLVTEDVPF